MFSLSSLRARVRPSNGEVVEVPIPASGTHRVGPVELDVALGDREIRWSIAPVGREPVALDAVALVWDAGPAGGAPLMFSQGYQSWAPTRTLRLGIDADPSSDERMLPLVGAAFSADPGRGAPGELRSEQVTVLRTGAPQLACVGFRGGETHAGTLRARLVDDRVDLCAEAWLGGAQLTPGVSRRLHDVVAEEGDDATALLSAWADRERVVAGARVDAPFTVGWCSWYHYFHDVTEQAVHENLARAGDWPFDVFQLDDGFQHEIGDWLRTNEKFPAGVGAMADAIGRAGAAPGIWLAPFLAAPNSDLAHAHPDWLAAAPRGDGFAIGMYHEVWGGVMAMLDTTNPQVLEHLAATAAALVGMGYRYLKLDFTFAAAMPGRFHDPTRTPAERVRAGFDAIRRGAGDDVFILGCGAPIGATVGTVDAMRIGADVAPWWNDPTPPGRQPELSTPATRHAFVNTCTRNFMHRRLWSNDPDCIMLRTAETELAPAAAEAWAQTVGVSGGLVLVSDDLALLGSDARRLLDDICVRGRASDAAARDGRPAEALGLLDPAGPYGLVGDGGSIRVDMTTGHGEIA